MGMGQLCYRVDHQKMTPHDSNLPRVLIAADQPDVLEALRMLL